MKKLLLLSVTILLLQSNTLAQAPDTLWTKTFGETDYEVGNSVQQTSDGGYIVAGTTSSFGSGYNDVWLIKTNASGDTLWTKTFGGTDHEVGNSIQQTVDGGYIVAGYTSSFGAGERNVYLIKTNSSGYTLWTKTYGGWAGNSVQQTSDGGYIIAGTSGFPQFDSNVYLIKTDSSGDTLWTKTFGGNGSDMGSSVQQTSDGGYIVAGHKVIFEGYTDIYLIKTDSSGDTLWTKTFGGIFGDECNSVQQTSDGGYIVAGFTHSFGAGQGDVYLIKTDSSGDTLWTRTFGGIVQDEGYSVQQTSDGGYIVAGFTNGYFSEDVYLIKTDSSGDILWTKTLGGIVRDVGHSVQQTSDGGYIVAGFTYSFGAGEGDVWLIKVGADPTSIDENLHTFINNYHLFENYPNPFNPSTKISWQSPVGSHQTIKVFDVLGNEIATLIDEYKPAGSYTLKWNAANLPSGIYFYQLKAGSYVETKKMILIK
jgi:hypothetical protein